jgi:hypothetical protein
MEALMRIIPTRIHAMTDYLMGILLIASPFLFGFADGGVGQWLPIILGIGVIAYSLVTRYEYSVAGLISMPVHLALDGLGGALLVLAPWLFGFAETVFWPHVILGLIEIGASLMTKTHPESEGLATHYR